MRINAVIAAAAVAVSLAGPLQAADINEQGAKDLLGNLTYFLPQDLVKLITVNTADGRYLVTYDLPKLFDKLKTTGFDITGLKPVTAYVTPQDGGLWTIEGSNALDVTARSKPGQGPDAEFHYAMASSTYNGVFDDALHYVKSMDAKANGITFSTKTTDRGVQKNDGTVDGIAYTLSSANGGDPDRIDIQMNGGLKGFYDKISSDVATFAEIRVGSIDVTAGATKLPLKALNEIIQFASAHKDEHTLSPKDGDAFKTILLNAMPIAGSFAETVSATDISVTSPFGSGGVQKMDYTFKVDGPTNAVDFDAGYRLEKMNLSSTFIPAEFVAFVPDVAEFQVSVPDINLAAVGDLIQQMDFNKPDATTEQKFQQTVFPDGNVTVTFPKISAISGSYDFEASGTMKASLYDKDRVSMQMTVFARDLDKTIAAVQNAAKAEPKLNTASFGLMMAKGFAKTDPDGRSRWDITLADDKTVTVNGQVIK